MLQDNMKRIRKSRGMRQSDIASRLNVHTNTIARWEQGRTEPKRAELESLASVLSTTVHELIKDIDEPMAPNITQLSKQYQSPATTAEQNSSTEPKESQCHTASKRRKLESFYDVLDIATMDQGMTLEEIETALAVIEAAIARLREKKKKLIVQIPQNEEAYNKNVFSDGAPTVLQVAVNN